ncbi:hypothetical protein RB195_008928 [Necator americanus]|uniref:Protein kinase domain-containing protein n=1 Tax=Necator americanus TaxID=51031 RepID=A0ABR1CRT2_NECAM
MFDFNSESKRSMNHIAEGKAGRISSISTQTRVGINILFGVKQLHDIGFVHRDLKPANVAVGRENTPEYRFFHILDFGLAREFVVIGGDKKLQMRRPRPKALFRGTTRYCSINTHDKGEQGRVDDLWSVLYMLAEMRGTLPWANLREKKDINDMKKRTFHEVLLKNSPVQLVNFARHLDTLNYYSHPDYARLHGYLMEIMKAGKFKFTDPYDWETKKKMEKRKTETVSIIPTTIKKDNTQGTCSLNVPVPATGHPKKKQSIMLGATEENPFPAEWFRTNPLGF